MGYRLLILGVRVTKDKYSDVDSENCFSLITAKMIQHFKRISDVTIGFGDRVFDLDMIDDSWDFVLFIGYTKEGVVVRERVPKGKMLTLLEYPFPSADWSFCFLPTGIPNTTKFDAPVSKDMLVNVPKEKSIVIDHWWRPLGDDQKDWTLEISDWLSSLKGEYKIYRMIRFGEEESKTVQPHEIPLTHTQYWKYLEQTNRAETFVCTHTESYGYGIIDMVARGIRAVVFPGALNEELIQYFQLPTFNNCDELLGLVRSPVEPRWNDMIHRCTDFSDIARIIDVKCRDLLGLPWT